MTDLQLPAGSVPPRLLELASLFDGCRKSFLGVADDTHWQPEQGSWAEMDAKALPTPDPRLPEATTASGHALVMDVVLTYLQMAVGHLGGLAALYARGEVFFPPALLVRAVLEHCAHAAWVLGDPENLSADPPGNRLTRAYLEEELSGLEGNKAARHLGTRQSDIAQDAKVALSRVRSHIDAIFPGSSLKELTAGRLDGQQRLKPQECVIWMYELFAKRAGSSVEAVTAEGVYDFLSNYTHPTLYPARQLREWTDHGDHVGSDLRIEIHFLEWLASAAVLAYYSVLALTIDYMGLSRERHDALAVQIDTYLPGALI